ncbi:MAG: hypothetical protein ACI9I0_000121 [Rhodoferax sp.]|jgi:uncharacterized protein YbjT (DUF2867 family)
MKKIAIFGGHGKVAMKLARILMATGHQVTSVIRKPEQQAEVAGTGAQPVLLDLAAATTLEMAEALRGHDAVVWSAGAGGGAPEHTYAVDRDAAIRSMDAAVLAGASRFVMVSYMGAGPDHRMPDGDGFYAYAEAKAAADAYLRGTGLAWTILGPGSLTDNPATGTIELSPIDISEGNDTARDNVALVVTAVLDLPATAGRTIDFRDGATPLAEALAASV